jgi:hypothetical protein
MRQLLNKIKQAIKKAFSRGWQKTDVNADKTSREVGKKTALDRIATEASPIRSASYIPSAQEAKRQIYPAPAELPSGYAQDKIVLQVRDPRWIHAYWEVSEATWQGLSRAFPEDAKRGFKKILRVYDISQIIFNGDNAHSFFDIEVTAQANNWYIETSGPGRSWCVDLGLLLQDGKFITIIRSNAVTTPLDSASRIIDEQWMIPEEMFRRLYGMGVGIGSSPLKLNQMWEERLKREFGSGALFSVSSNNPHG